jgi:serpin B
MRSIPFPFVPFFLAALVPACDSNAATPDRAPQPEVDAPASRVPELVPPTTAELTEVAESDDAFAVDLFSRARHTPGNLAFSPLSVMTALAMAEAGARGDTLAEMQRVMHQTGTAEHATELVAKLAADLQRPLAKVTLRIADRLFGDLRAPIEPSYAATMQRWFGAPVASVDFVHSAEASRQTINAWVASETHQRIQDLVPPGGVGPSTRLVIANAVYFLGDWETPFVKSATRGEAFHASATDAHDVPTMHAHGAFRYGVARGATVLEVPYRGGELAMDIVLPDAATGLDALELGLTKDALAGIAQSLRTAEVNVSLPRFEVSPKAPLALGAVLRELGMSRAFSRAPSPDGADFTGIANPPRAEDRFSIGEVFHKAFVKVDETGTEAAAATSVMAVAGAAAVPVVQTFRADRPFLFTIRHLRSGAVLFMGRVADPAQK